MITEQKKVVFKTFSNYFLAFCLSLLAFMLIVQTPFPFNIPYDYWGDALFSQSWVKSIVDNGWYLTNPYLGAPNGYMMTDFPMSDNFHFLIMKILSFFTSDYAVILNTFYLLTYPTITLTALFVLQRLGVLYPLALTASLLFALMPFHFLRSEKHLLLSSYYVVPLAIWLAILVGSGKIALSTPSKKYLYWRLFSPMRINRVLRRLLCFF